MAKIKQIGPGRKTSGTFDGVTYVTTKNGLTYVRALPAMPAYMFKTHDALKRQGIFRMVQEHIKFHLRTIKKTFTPKGNGTVSNRYFSLNHKHLSRALDSLAERMVTGEDISLNEIESAISTYAVANPNSIAIAAKSGYAKVFLTGSWPDTITLNANSGDSTVIIIVAENGVTTTITPAGDSTVTPAAPNGGTSSSVDEPQSVSVAAPTISGSTTFAESTQVTMACATAGASIYYTTDGSTPSAASTLYSEPLTLSDTTTVKAIAVKGGESSAVTTQMFSKSSGQMGEE